MNYTEAPLSVTYRRTFHLGSKKYVVFHGETGQVQSIHLKEWDGHIVTIYLFGVLRRFQHCTGHIMTGSWKGRGNQYIQFVRVLYCKLPTNGKQLPAFPLEAVLGIEPRPQRWEARVLPLWHRGSCVPCLIQPDSSEYSVHWWSSLGLYELSVRNLLEIYSSGTQVRTWRHPNRHGISGKSIWWDIKGSVLTWRQSISKRSLHTGYICVLFP